ncbi:hypothetical protein C8R43DRAFT_946405 [Mycena crocata]|nr:hypothetical protein C8R43DRAFT_946405 [Mycena crocata]
MSQMSYVMVAPASSPPAAATSDAGSPSAATMDVVGKFTTGTAPDSTCSFFTFDIQPRPRTATATTATAMMAALAPSAVLVPVVVVGTPVPPINPTGIHLTGPGEVYGVVPLAPLSLVPDNGQKWYAVTKGRYVGCTPSASVAEAAVTGVSHALRAGFGSQALAVQAFNSALASPLGLVLVTQMHVPPTAPTPPAVPAPLAPAPVVQTFDDSDSDEDDGSDLTDDACSADEFTDE